MLIAGTATQATPISAQATPTSPSPEGEQEFDEPAPGRESVYYNAKGRYARLNLVI